MSFFSRKYSIITVPLWEKRDCGKYCAGPHKPAPQCPVLHCICIELQCALHCKQYVGNLIKLDSLFLLDPLLCV